MFEFQQMPLIPLLFPFPERKKMQQSPSDAGVHAEGANASLGNDLANLTKGSHGQFRKALQAAGGARIAQQESGGSRKQPSLAQHTCAFCSCIQSFNRYCKSQLPARKREGYRRKHRDGQDVDFILRSHELTPIIVCRS